MGNDINGIELAREHLLDLSTAEFRVFILVGSGLSNKEIAEKLFISPLTLRVHLKRIYDKLYVKGRARLAVLSYKFCQERRGDAHAQGGST